MKKGTGSKKGSSFEREICKDFSLWVSNGLRDDLFWRTPQSGGRATERIKKGLTADDYAGDMMALNKSGRVLTKPNIFEFKSGYSSKSREHISLTSLIDKLESNKEPLIIKWWKKLEEEKKQHNKERCFLVYKRDRKQKCIAMSSNTWLIEFGNYKNLPKYAIIRHNNYYLCICLLEDFFQYFKPDKICDSSKPIKDVSTFKLNIRRKKKLNIRRK